MKSKVRKLLAAFLLLVLFSGAAIGNMQIRSARAAEESIKVKLDVGEELYYGSYYTRFYTADGKTAYCLEPQKLSPSSGEYKAHILEKGSLRKGLYYLYGGPGYETYVSKYGYFGFSEEMRKTEEYCMSHCIAAYFYLGNDDAFFGLSGQQADALKIKAEKILSLPEPPEYYGAVVFETDAKSQVMGGTGKELTGSVEVQKRSSVPEWTEGNACYSLKGAVYGLFENGKDEPSYRIETDERGYGRADDVRLGSYEIREIKSPKGYAVNPEQKKITVKADAAVIYSCADNPCFYPAELILEKVDADTKKAEAQGSASLEDARFTVRFYPGYYDTDPGQKGIEPEKIWVVKTDAQGKASLSDGSKVSGDSFYRNPSKEQGKYVFPLGTVTFEETRAPRGYLRNEEIIIRKITQEGEREADTVFQIPKIPEKVVKGHLQIVKFCETQNDEAERKKPLEGIRFTVTSKTTGITTEIKTDKNGYASTREHGDGGLVYDTYIIKEENTPEGFAPADEFEITIEEEKTHYYILENRQIYSPVKLVKRDSTTGKVIPVAGAVFELLDEEKKPVKLTVHYPSESNSSRFVTDESGSFILPEKLPAGIYYFREIKAPEGYLLNDAMLCFHIREEQDWKEPVIVECENRPAAEKIHLIKRDAESAKKIAGVRFDIFAGEDIVTPDGTVRLKAGEKAGSMITDGDGSAWSEELFPGRYYIEETETAAGYMLPGKAREVHVSYTHGKGVEVTVENYRSRITDTNAVWKKSGAKKTESGTETVITDTVELEYLNKGQEYTLKGILVDAQTLKPVRTGKGSETEMRFTPRQSEMAVDMDLSVDTGSLAGKRLVVYEYLYMGDELLSSHEDPDDEGQTVEISEKEKPAAETGDVLTDMGNITMLAASSASAGLAAAGIKLISRRKKHRGK